VSVWPSPAALLGCPAVEAAVDGSAGVAEPVAPDGSEDPQAARTNVATAAVRTKRFMRLIVEQFALDAAERAFRYSSRDARPLSGR